MRELAARVRLAPDGAPLPPAADDRRLWAFAKDVEGPVEPDDGGDDAEAAAEGLAAFIRTIA